MYSTYVTLDRSADGRDAVLGVVRHSFLPALLYVCLSRRLSLSSMLYLPFLIQPITSPERLRLPHGLRHGTLARCLPLPSPPPSSTTSVPKPLGPTANRARTPPCASTRHQQDATGAAQRGSSSPSDGGRNEKTLSKQARAATERAQGKKRTRLRQPKGPTGDFRHARDGRSRRVGRRRGSCPRRISRRLDPRQRGAAISSATNPGSKITSHTSLKSR
jgi:hypothetical protein